VRTVFFLLAFERLNVCFNLRGAHSVYALWRLTVAAFEIANFDHLLIISRNNETPTVETHLHFCNQV